MLGPKKAFFAFAKSTNWPTRHQWNQLFKTFNRREQILVAALTILIIIANGVLLRGYYSEATTLGPDNGGQYIEGFIGYPQYLNPVLAPSNDVDRDLVKLLFSSLFKYNRDGNLTGDLAESYNVGDFGKIIDVFLKKDAVWSDGAKLTADDVLFTIQLIQDPAFKSPLRPNLSGIEVEKLDDYSLRFKLKNYYAPFLQNLTFGILQKKSWQSSSASQFPLSELNLRPITCGPYLFSELQKDKDGTITSLTLKANNDYFGEKAFLKTVQFQFFENQDQMLSALNRGNIEAISNAPVSWLDNLKSFSSLQIHSFAMPRYFAIFFNQNQSVALSDRNVRLALNYATDKDEVVQKAIKGQGYKVNGPLLPELPGYAPNYEPYGFNLETAKKLLDQAGWKDIDNDGIREKGNEKLSIGLAVPNWPEMNEAAEILKRQWKEAGVNLELQVEDSATLQQTILRPRQYQAIFFGEILSKEPDPFAFWHSSQKNDPGLNISLYDNKEVDQLLSSARQEFDEQKRADEYKKFQDLLSNDAPAVFLYSQNFLFAANKQVKGIGMNFVNMPSDRFNNINEWYIKTQRVFK